MSVRGGSAKRLKSSSTTNSSVVAAGRDVGWYAAVIMAEKSLVTGWWRGRGCGRV